MATIDEIRQVLRDFEALIVHFSTNMKNQVIPPFAPYPKDLHDVEANNHWELSTTTVCASWTDCNFPPGYIGLIIDPNSGSSITHICPDDCGSRLDPETKRRVSDGELATVQNMPTCVQVPGHYSEWIVGDFTIRGVFVRDFNRMEARVMIEERLEGDMTISAGPENVFIPLKNVFADFPGKPIYSIVDGQFVELHEDATPSAVKFSQIYPWASD